MKCTSCKKGVLTPTRLDKQIPCMTCNSCKGNWLYLEDYLSWKEKNPEAKFKNIKTNIKPRATTSALLCPKTSIIMSRFRISSKYEYKINLSPTINGIWLEKDVWELLKKEGLADKLNQIFTDPWQRKIKKEMSKAMFENMYQQQFGEDDYEEIKKIKAWLSKHPKKIHLIGYLHSDNPYSATN
ncbi:zf-TFIIB domain-containing protein [Spartinivicinus poritis]|uniref:Zf-TFIIB domain-containing protein n=1 Tax=Spartinivicinus poritis TaxID=2994640 RepID=A0ABT5U203_9GAMM|nr:zf-TFIIB domain-containing protein [Spartinivicinus sp. A2-2]MDE1460405.1 zf-TFIIB domain-containing protein [Spartinivicinus sp. A2-2]